MKPKSTLIHSNSPSGGPRPLLERVMRYRQVLLGFGGVAILSMSGCAFDGVGLVADGGYYPYSGDYYGGYGPYDGGYGGGYDGDFLIGGVRHGGHYGGHHFYGSSFGRGGFSGGSHGGGSRSGGHRGGGHRR